MADLSTFGQGLSTPSSGELPAAAPFPDQLMQSFTEGVLSYPQVSIGMSIYMADTAVKNILRGQCTWSDFETFTPTSEHVTTLGKLLCRAHEVNGVPVRTHEGADRDFQGETVGNERISQIVTAYGSTGANAIGRFASTLLPIRSPERDWSAFQTSSVIESRKLFAREMFAQHEDGTTMREVQALDMLLGAAVDVLQPSNPEAARVKREWRGVLRDQCKPEHSQDKEFKARVTERESRALIELGHIVYKGIRNVEPEIQSLLGYSVPMIAEDFVSTIGH